MATFIERFAGSLIEAGMPRMPSRVFAALLVSDSGYLTAAELSERLLISPAAVSGAVRYLNQVDLVSRERERGARRDHYRVNGDVWFEASLHREQMLNRWADRLREGIAALGAQTPAGVRMGETLEFIEFVLLELPLMLDRWKERRAALRDSRGQGSGTGGTDR